MGVEVKAGEGVKVRVRACLGVIVEPKFVRLQERRMEEGVGVMEEIGLLEAEEIDLLAAGEVGMDKPKEIAALTVKEIGVKAEGIADAEVLFVLVMGYVVALGVWLS